MTNITALNTTVIDPGDLAYVPFAVWAVLFALTFIFLFHAIMAERNIDVTALIATILAGVTAWVSGFIEFSTVEVVTFADGNSTVVPASYIIHPTWLSYIMIGVFLVGILLVWKNVYIVYFTRKPYWKQERYR
jgi:hypothetical protein